MASTTRSPMSARPSQEGSLESDLVLPLERVDLSMVERVGAKAARLGALANQGFPVPAGVVVTVEATRSPNLLHLAAGHVIERLGTGPVAVRSSAVAEDQADASFAGLYETVLGVYGREDLEIALERVVASACDSRVESYRDQDEPASIAVLVQQMVDADEAGVAFTAHPLTGARNEVIVTAVSGLGEQLVSGDVDGETWTVTGDHAVTNDGRGVLDRAKAVQVAELARRVETLEGCPQDIEWAFARGQLHLLQARPMTALPDEVSWTTTVKNPFLRRDFRCAEWLAEPVTPLFETWYLPLQDQGFAAIQREMYGGGMEAPFHAVVNGWYYAGIGQPGPSALRGMLLHPLYGLRWAKAFHRVGQDPVYGEKHMAQPAVEAHHTLLMPRYRRIVEDAEEQIPQATFPELVALIDAVAHASGSIMYSIADGAGYGWKAEGALVAFCKKHIDDRPLGYYQPLVAGLHQPGPPVAHAVTNLDWCHPTAGERQDAFAGISPQRHAELRNRREQLERECRDALSARPKLVARFDTFLDIAQRYARIREEITADLTFGWPVMRAALGRIGEQLTATGTIDHPDDVYWLTRHDIDEELAGSTRNRAEDIARRRDAWAHQNRLSPPEWIGKPSKAYLKRRETLAVSHATTTDALLVGVPASPGRATGPVRIVTDTDQFDQVAPGDILVARLTAPAWTPLFARVAAVITDSGSVAAHASLIAREFGIPAVVATHHGTTTLRNGQTVIVDGTAGIITAEDQLGQTTDWSSL